MLINILARHRTEGLNRFAGFTVYGRRLYWRKVPSTVNRESVLKDLRSDPNVDHAERTEPVPTCLPPDDADWTFDAAHLRAEDAWDIENVVLALLDQSCNVHALAALGQAGYGVGRVQLPQTPPCEVVEQVAP